MDILITNIPFIIVLVILAIRIVAGIKKGAVKELFSAISMIIASVLVLLIAFAVRKYFDQDRVIFVITIVLIALLTILYKIMSLFFETLKIIAKLPGIGFINKLISIPLAVCEVVIMVWAVYCLIMIMDAGAIEVWIMNCVRNNSVMKFLYQYNYMYSIVANFSSTLKDINIWEKLGM